jgi:hypothetical protein
MVVSGLKGQAPKKIIKKKKKNPLTPHPTQNSHHKRHLLLNLNIHWLLTMCHFVYGNGLVLFLGCEESQIHMEN